MANLQIKIGEKHNRLTLINYVENTKDRHPLGEFLCECGNKTITRINRVFRQDCKSCGCLNKEMARDMCLGKLSITHGLTSTNKETKRIYNVYRSMLARCYNPNVKVYKDYGGRGITVCDEWKNNPLAYYDWCVENNYTTKMHIDRIDNNGNYSPENCRIVTSKVNCNNTRTNNVVNFKGVDMTISEMADLIGMRYCTLRTRLMRDNMTPEQAYSIPLKRLAHNAKH